MWSLRKHDSRSRGILKGKWKMDDWEHFYDAGLTPNIIYNLNKLLDNYLARFAFCCCCVLCAVVALLLFVKQNRPNRSGCNMFPSRQRCNDM